MRRILGLLGGVSHRLCSLCVHRSSVRARIPRSLNGVTRNVTPTGLSEPSRDDRWLPQRTTGESLAFFRFESAATNGSIGTRQISQRRSFLAWLEVVEQDPLAVLSTPALDEVDHEVKAEWGLELDLANRSIGFSTSSTTFMALPARAASSRGPRPPGLSTTNAGSTSSSAPPSNSLPGRGRVIYRNPTGMVHSPYTRSTSPTTSKERSSASPKFCTSWKRARRQPIGPRTATTSWDLPLSHRSCWASSERRRPSRTERTPQATPRDVHGGPPEPQARHLQRQEQLREQHGVRRSSPRRRHSEPSIPGAAAVPPGFGRGVCMVLIASEIHPFLDGNGRATHRMMNAELSAHGLCRIVLPTVIRNEYLLSLRRFTNGSNIDALIRILDHCWRWTSSSPGPPGKPPTAARGRGARCQRWFSAVRGSCHDHLRDAPSGGHSPKPLVVQAALHRSD